MRVNTKPFWSTEDSSSVTFRSLVYYLYKRQALVDGLIMNHRCDLHIKKPEFEKWKPEATWRSEGADSNNLSYHRATAASVTLLQPTVFMSRCSPQSGITNTRSQQRLQEAHLAAQRCAESFKVCLEYVTLCVRLKSRTLWSTASRRRRKQRLTQRNDWQLNVFVEGPGGGEAWFKNKGFGKKRLLTWKHTQNVDYVHS